MKKLSLLFLAILWPLPTFAQQRAQCAPQEQMGITLMQRYGESVVGNGVVDEKHILEFYLSPKGSWTVVITNSDDVSCRIAGGMEWEFARPQPKGRKS